MLFKGGFLHETRDTHFVTVVLYRHIEQVRQIADRLWQPQTKFHVALRGCGQTHCGKHNQCDATRRRLQMFIE